MPHSSLNKQFPGLQKPWGVSSPTATGSFLLLCCQCSSDQPPLYSMGTASSLYISFPALLWPLENGASHTGPALAQTFEPITINVGGHTQGTGL